MRLFIAEKPSVAKAIAGVLGKTGQGDGFILCGNDVVVACFGHMFGQAEPDKYLPDDIPRNRKGKKVWREQDLPIVPAKWVIEPKSEARDRLKVIKQYLAKATVVINAGDPDREGQLLIDEILQEYRYRGPVLRYWASAQDEVSVTRALADLKPNEQFVPMGLAAFARSCADWLIGMNLTRAYTLQALRAGIQALLSVGRVQTPTLAMVVARDLEIENFKPKGYYVLQALIAHAKGKFLATWKAPAGFKGLDEEGRLTDPAVADALVRAASGQPGTIAEYKVEARKDQHPRCFSLTDITARAAKRFGYSADQTLKICQSLYEEHKLTSYPRTDCGWLPESQFPDASRVLDAVRRTHPGMAGIVDRADPRMRSRTWNDGEISAHHGIIPTMQAGDVSKLSQEERNLYELIVRQYVAQFYPLHEYMSTSVTAAVAGQAWVASGKTVTKMGWRELFSAPPKVTANAATATADAADDDEESADGGPGQNLPPMARGDAVQCLKVDRQDRKTTPPPRYDEGSLLQAMENVHQVVTDPKEKQLLKEGDGIGTPATRASIIKELKKRTFLEDRKEGRRKVIVSTALARNFLASLPAPVRSPTLTALFERSMKEIEAGRMQVEAFLDQQVNFVRKLVEQANAGAAAAGIGGSAGGAGGGAGHAGAPSGVGPQCPKCGKGQLRLLPPKPGKPKVWGCSAYREGCQAFYDDKAGAPDIAPKPEFNCPACKVGLLRRIPGGRSGYFWGCGRYKEGCKGAFNDLNGKPDLTPRMV